jgi:hypothetical protein
MRVPSKYFNFDLTQNAYVESIKYIAKFLIM